MSSIKVSPNASGTGIFTIAAPNSNTDRTLTLPDSTGTIATAESTLSQFNASGSAPVYACRAWVNFNGTGTVAIRASGNVSSITDNGVGDYTVNFTTTLVDANYSVNALAQFTNDNRSTFAAMGSEIRSVTTPLATSSSRIGTGRTFSPYSLEDALSVCVAIFR